MNYALQLPQVGNKRKVKDSSIDGQPKKKKRRKG